MDKNTIAFLKDHKLMWNAVPAFFDNCPVLTMNRDSNYGFRFTGMAIDVQSTAINSARYDIIFLSSTDNNRIYKFLNKARKFYSSKITCLKADGAPLLQVIQSGNAVRHLSKIFLQDYHQQTDKRIDRRLILLSEKSIASIASSYCDQATTCSGCVELMDPYCAWNIPNGVCVNIGLR
uniref:Sema domain-containing protein n=1 Tax=Romanomermis culicivorax TaxID=13658 RepID=A0A915L9J2_ROMCU